MDCDGNICCGGDYISSNFLFKLANYVVQNEYTRKERKIARHENHRKEKMK